MSDILFKNTILEGKKILKVDGKYILVDKVPSEDISRNECCGEHYSHRDKETGKITIYHIHTKFAERCNVLGALSLPEGVVAESVTKYLTGDDIYALAEGTYKDSDLVNLDNRLTALSKK